MKLWKKLTVFGIVCSLCASALAGCQKKDGEVVIYTNADDEAITAMKAALDGSGFGGKYILQSFGTSELGGKLLAEGAAFYTPVTAQEGTILVNTEVIKEHNLPMPACLKDLADPIYADMVSVTDVKSSSTAWLLIQALVLLPD